MANAPDTKIMALFCDFENVALGVRDARYPKFDIDKVLERLLLKGNIVVKKAYCDWERYKEFKADMHEASFELIEIPHVRQSGKNSADIRMVVDALDLCYTKSHVDTFVVISGDSDFSPLVSKLRENNKVVIGVGVKNSASDLLIANCDEFIYYDDLVRGQQKRKPRKKAATSTSQTPAAVESSATSGVAETLAAPSAAGAAATTAPMEPSAPTGEESSATSGVAETLAAPSSAGAAATTAPMEPSAPTGEEEVDRKQAALDLVLETVEALFAERGSEEKLWGSMVKQALKRRKPGFNESYYGFRSFSKLLDEAASRKLLDLEEDEKSGGVIIRGFNPDY